MSQEKFKILIVTRRYPPYNGGAEQQLGRVAQALASRGHQARILCGNHRKDLPSFESKKHLEIRRLIDFQIHFFGTLFFLSQLVWQMWVLRKHYDLVISSHINETSCVCSWVCRLLKKPVVIRLSSLGKEGNLYWAKKRKLGKIYIRSCQRCDQFVCQNANHLVELESFGTQKTSIIPNMVSEDFLKLGVERKPEKKPPQLLWCNRFWQIKNPFILLKVINELKSSYPQIHCHVVGKGPLQDEFESLVDQKQLSNHITSHGFQFDTSGFYEPFSISLLTSIKETQPNSLLEAMAAGLPIVAPQIPGVNEMIEEGVTGLLVSPGDAKAIVKAIQKLLENPNLALDLGQKAHQRANEEHHPDKIALLWEDLFKKLSSTQQVKS